MPGDKGGKTKHDRCVEGVKENSPGVKNPHAVCVAAGVEPDKWKKSLDDATEVVKIDSNGQWRIEKMCGSVKKDDMAHPPGSPQDQAHDVIELDKDLQEEMKDLDDEGKREMLAHLRSYKDNPDKWKRSKKNQKAGDEKDEPGRD